MEYIIDILKWLGLYILGFTVLCLFIVFCVMPFSNNCYKGNKMYEYEDIDGNKGTAKDCMTIRGNLVCDLEDGTRVSVKSFKGICKD